MGLTVVVLAAGQGKRMRSALPKVLQPLAGRPLLGHVLGTARKLAPTAVRVVYGHGGEAVRAAFPGSDLDWCLQAEQLGTGHAVAQALPGVDDADAVLVVCGDVPLVSAAMLEGLLAALGEADLAVLTTHVDDPSGYGRVLRDDDGCIRAIVEEQDASSAERDVREINTGILAARAGALRGWVDRLGNDNRQGEYYLTDVVGLACRGGARVLGVAGVPAADLLGINDKGQLAVAERTLQRRRAASLMERGVTLADPERIEVRGDVAVGADVFIDVGVVLEGPVTIGDRARIGPYAVVAETRIGNDCRIHPHCVIAGATLASGCEIGPFARLRPGTELAANVKVGNFVEVKNSRVAAGSKMNHLSYVGDAEIGRDVNVGAGTITCNYDGAAKHRTVVGDGAFIGSGVMLVAPVEVGAGATIGAGSTISRNAPAGELTLARARQTSIEGWKKPRRKAAEKAGEDDG